MKYIKSYENITRVPQIGNYVAVKMPKMIKLPQWKIENFGIDLEKIYIAQIIDINRQKGIFKIKFGNDFYSIDKTWWMTKNEIIDFAIHPIYLEYILAADKYNL